MHNILTILLTGMLLFATGCTKTYTDTMSSAQYRSALVAYSLALPTKTITSQAVLQATVQNFANKHSDISKPVFIVSTSTLPNQISATAVRQALQALCIPGARLAIKAPDKLLRHTEITLQGYTIIPPAPATWDFPSKSYELANSRTVDGSSVNANIGAMIANPKNSAVRQELAPADGRYHTAVIKRYHGLTVEKSGSSNSDSSANNSNKKDGDK
ncbi:hypothetical protein [Halodesulfovibrio sp.]|uniref:hypothetical protein n=1 Tax=Halodesulfovibrio sp. TaxID=1912772 RepID=UPI0025EE263E|nr:hypothetical protein [Halodesulfovibrio sp.]MCT4625441.1 CpaD family pilus assembly protein [Halodesulfovibrio sp.]